MRSFVAPLRLSLVGGGTDVPPFCEIFGTKVINMAIRTFVRVDIQVNKLLGTCEPNVIIENFQGKPEKTTEVGKLLGAALANYFNFNDSLILNVKNPVKQGSGLGTSSVMVMTAIHAVSEYLEVEMKSEEKMKLARKIERQDMNIPGGFQDFIPAIYGGINRIAKKAESEEIQVEKLSVSSNFRDVLSNSICAIEVGIPRDSRAIIEDQSKRSMIENSKTQQALKSQFNLVSEIEKALAEEDLIQIASIIDESARLKKEFSPLIANPITESIENRLRNLGGVGVKISGAGGGGHIFCLFPQGIPDNIESRFTKTVRKLPIFIEEQGVREL